MELLSDDYLRGRFQHRANMRYLVLFAIVIAAVICAEVVSEQRVRRAEAYQVQVNATYGDAGDLLTQMRELEVRKAEMLRKANLTASLIDRVPCSTLLGVVTNALTSEVMVKGLELQTYTVAGQAQGPSPKKEAGSKFTTSSRKKKSTAARELLSMEVTGLAASDAEVAKFIANLSRSALIDRADLVYSVEKKTEDLTVREFQVKVFIKEGVDAIDVL